MKAGDSKFTWFNQNLFKTHFWQWKVVDIPDICHFFYTERILGFQNWHPKRTKIPKNGYVCAQFLKLFTWLASVTNIRYGGGWKEIKWEMIKTSQKLRMLSSVTIKCQGKILSWIEVLNCQIYNQCLKGTGDFEWCRQTMDELCVFGTSRTSNELKSGP